MEAGLLARVRLAEVARAYYLDGCSKVDIAERFGVSRFQVARLLEEAKASGIVTIEVHDPRSPRSGRETELATLLGLESVHVVADADGDSLDPAQRLGAAVLRRLGEMVQKGMTVGVSWSRTLDRSAHFLPPLPPCTLVQLTGASEDAGGGTFTRLLLGLDRRAGITTCPLYAPLVVDRPSTAKDLRRQPVVAETLARADALDVAVVAIGAWLPGESSVWEKVSPETRQACSDAGAVAEFSGIFIDGEGGPVHTPLEGRTIAVALPQLRRAQHCMGFALGAVRRDAVLAAVRTGVFSSLVVDAALADALLEVTTATSEEVG